MIHRLRDRCRACDGAELELVLPLGSQPLANALPASEEEARDENTYPLDLYVCRTCALVQLLDVIDPAVLFEHYLYVSGTSDTMAAHHRDYARDVARDYDLDGKLVVEVASNDGSLLKHFADEGATVLGVEPAKNIAELARDRGIETLDVFFDEAKGAELAEQRGHAGAVVANNVLAHVDDTRGLLAGMAALVGDEGVVVVEVPYVAEMVDRLEYDTIYHEHLCYFSVASLMRLGEAAGLSVVRVDRVPVHGGSLRVHARSRRSTPDHADEVKALAAEEDERGLCGVDRYHRFAADVRANREALLELLHQLKSEGSTLAAYGAPAKGNTLLNYGKIGTDLLEFTVDKSPLKVGRLTPGMHLPILAAEELAERKPDYTLILAWNFAEEIQRQQAAYLAAGGRFLVPLPEPRVL